MDTVQDRHQRELFRLLYDTALSAGLVVVEDKINRRGGVCRLDEKIMVIYDLHAPLRERNRLIVNGLRLLDREGLYLPPKVREMVERQAAEGEGQHPGAE